MTADFAFSLAGTLVATAYCLTVLADRRVPRWSASASRRIEYLVEVAGTFALIFLFAGVGIALWG